MSDIYVEIFRKYRSHVIWLLGRPSRYEIVENNFNGAVDEVLARYIFALERHGDIDHPKAFIAGIVRYYILERKRENKKRNERFEFIPDFDNFDFEDKKQLSAIRKVLERTSYLDLNAEDLLVIRECLEQLTEDERFCFLNYYVQGRTYEEIEEFVPYTYVTVGKRVISASEKMRECVYGRD